MNLTASKNWVDTHFHVFHADEAVSGARYAPNYAALLTDWMALAHGVGVTRGVCVQPSFSGENNRMLLSSLSAHPDTLRGVAVFAPDTPAATLMDMHALGVRGLRLNLAGVSHDISAWTRAASVWQTMLQLGWHLEVHTDQGALPQVLAQLPNDVPLVVDHMAKPHVAHSSDASVAALVARARHAPTFIKLSGAYRLGGVDAASLAHIWLHELGPQALLWGSDWPCTNHEQLAHYPSLLTSLESWVGADNLDTVLSHNPQRLYWGHGASL
jgi:predicted TIM-barrel fold metal-dependent hydrolase